MMMNTYPGQHEQQPAASPMLPRLRDRMPADRLISAVGLTALLVMVGIYLIRPLYDPDFYWHLKTGEWIWQNRSLPRIDPFGVLPSTVPPPRTEFILTSYWLAQIAMYALYSLCGMSGIILFRLVIMGAWVHMLSRWTTIRDSRVAMTIAIGTIQLLELYFAERPQFVSFICFGLILVTLFRFLDRPENRSLCSNLLPMSLVMIAWANMHGGYIIGQAVLIYFMAAEGIKYLNRSLAPLPPRDYGVLCLASLGALLASFINPNTANTIKYLPEIFDTGNYVNRNILEEMSLINYYRATHQGTVFVYAATVAVTICAFASSGRRRDITWIGIMAGTAFMGCTHMRLMPFFLVTALLFLTKYLETENSAVKGRIVTYCMLAATVLICFADELPNRFREPVSKWVPVRYFPVTAADLITGSGIGGNIFTTLHWGGYMIWRAGPDRKVFFDGRFTSVQRAWEYNNSLVIAKNRKPYWKGLFATYDIRIAIMPAYGDDGTPHPLTASIAEAPEWTTIFADGDQVVFVRNDSVQEGI